MKCHVLQKQIHPYLDGELSPRQANGLEEHLRQCSGCRKHHWELNHIREGLRPRRLSQAHQEWVWQRIQGRIEASPVGPRSTPVDRLRAWLREVEPEAVGSRLAAIPITLLLFLAIFVQFEPTLYREWTSSSMVVTLSPATPPSLPIVSEMPVRYPRAEIQDLMSAVQRIPFEDSLSLVAEITPEGHAQIDDVLEYPRSRELLSAVDLTLRGSAFQQARGGNRRQPFMIYSLQKVDVFAEYEGL